MNTYKKTFCLAAVVLVLGMAGNASALVWWWPGTSDWATASNWSTSAVPTSADDLRIDEGNTPYAVIDANTTAYAKGFYLGGSPTDNLTIYGSLTTYSANVAIAHDTGGTSTLYVKSGASVTIGKWLMHVADKGTGTLDMEGGTWTASTIRVGSNSGSVGHIQLDGGTLNASTLELGVNGTGTMDIEAGTLILDGNDIPTINSEVSSGDLTAYGGSGTINVDYNVTNAGKTTVTASAGGSPPDQVTGASPSDGAISQAITVDISWSAATGADDYDAYFGTDATPDAGELKGNQAGLSYEPGTLSNATTYYWRIDSNNSNGTTTGNVWSFTTVVVSPPDQVTGASPSDGATNQAITVDISWSAATGADNYDVYFGESSPGTSQGNQAGLTFDPGTLTNDTTYLLAY